MSHTISNRRSTPESFVSGAKIELLHVLKVWATMNANVERLQPAIAQINTLFNKISKDKHVRQYLEIDSTTEEYADAALAHLAYELHEWEKEYGRIPDMKAMITALHESFAE